MSYRFTELQSKILDRFKDPVFRFLFNNPEARMPVLDSPQETAHESVRGLRATFNRQFALDITIADMAEVLHLSEAQVQGLDSGAMVTDEKGAETFRVHLWLLGTKKLKESE